MSTKPRVLASRLGRAAAPSSLPRRSLRVNWAAEITCTQIRLRHAPGMPAERDYRSFRLHCIESALAQQTLAHSGTCDGMLACKGIEKAMCAILHKLQGRVPAGCAVQTELCSSHLNTIVHKIAAQQTQGCRHPESCSCSPILAPRLGHWQSSRCVSISSAHILHVEGDGGGRQRAHLRQHSACSQAAVRPGIPEQAVSCKLSVIREICCAASLLQDLPGQVPNSGRLLEQAIMFKTARVCPVPAATQLRTRRVQAGLARS